jgi:hypothetical protein
VARNPPEANIFPSAPIHPVGWLCKQIADYLKSHTPTTNTLIATMEAGALNDMIVGTPLEQAAANGLSNLRLLAEAGARDFVLPIPNPPELVPLFIESFPWLTNLPVAQFVALLDEGLEELKADYPLTVYQPDLFALWYAIWENPTAYGFHAPFVYPYTEVHCDKVHFALAANIIICQETYRLLTPPLRISSAVRTTEGDLALTWSGGSAPFQVQRTADLRSGQWKPDGPLIFLSEATVKCESSQGYFRVIFLGQ